MFRANLVVSAALALLCATTAAASDFDNRLEDRLRGAWVVLGAEVYSNCSGTYSDNTVGTAGVTSKAEHRFAPGELAKIDKVKVKRSRIDLLATIAEPVLTPYSDGPFELYEVRECKAQLIFEVPREILKGGDLEAVLQIVGRTVTPYADRQSAEASEPWNGRRQEPFPPDYDVTLTRYHIWQAEQTNAEVAARMNEATEAAADAADDIERDPDYLDGFAAGAEKMRHEGPDDCSELIGASYSSWRDRPPSGKSSTWKRGWEDGQRLVFNVELLDGLRHCFVAVPLAP